MTDNRKLYDRAIDYMYDNDGYYGEVDIILCVGLELGSVGGLTLGDLSRQYDEYGQQVMSGVHYTSTLSYLNEIAEALDIDKLHSLVNDCHSVFNERYDERGYLRR